MQCDRLLQMIKSWYIHVREETMAPARMVAFIEQHAENCDVCLQDPELPGEISKITELVLPESKIPKAVRQQNTKLKEAEAKLKLKLKLKRMKPKWMMAMLLMTTMMRTM
jgi:hypothetical protein